MRHPVARLCLSLCYHGLGRGWHLVHPLTSSMAPLYLCLVERSLTSETISTDLVGCLEWAGLAGDLYCPRCHATEREMDHEKSVMSSSQCWEPDGGLAVSYGAPLSCRETSLIAAVAAYVLSGHLRGRLGVVYDFAKRQRRRLTIG